jgi:hypothetical protein
MDDGRDRSQAIEGGCTVNQNEKEGQSAGRTTGASGTKAEHQQDRTIEGQESQPGKIWQESDQGQPGGKGGDAGIRGGFDETRGSAEDQSEQVNEQMDESQWQGSRFSSGGSTGQGG